MREVSSYALRATEGLSQRAQSFVSGYSARIYLRPLEEKCRLWLDQGISTEQIHRMAAFEQRWGGLIVPTAPAYEGGPICFAATAPAGSDEDGWWFDAGTQQTANLFSFKIGPRDEFGIHGETWAPLHAGMEGWIEAVALANHAMLWADSITTVHGADVDEFDLSGFEQVPEVQGLTDTWWRKPGTYVAIFRGEVAAAGSPSERNPTAQVYSGLPEHF